MEDLKNVPSSLIKNPPIVNRKEKKIEDFDDEYNADGRGRKKMSIVDMISHDADHMRRQMMHGHGDDVTDGGNESSDEEDGSYEQKNAKNSAINDKIVAHKVN